MDTKDMWIGLGGLALITALVVGSLFGAYKVGRWYERKDLTQYFAQMTVATYQDGYQDGFKLSTELANRACTAEKKAMKQVWEADEDGRY